MSEGWLLAATWFLAWMAGLVLGAVFYGGLWWTVQKGLSSPQPAVWFLGSFLVRTGMVLAGFYVVSGGRGDRLLACFLGFLLARVVVTRLTRSSVSPRRESPRSSVSPRRLESGFGETGLREPDAKEAGHAT
jgi:F1F0 ATPase subunit 2